MPSSMWDFAPIASGCLPGRHQTIVRAELTAAIAAVHDAFLHGHEFCIWSDNARVVSLMQQMSSDPNKTWGRKIANHDCIEQLAAEFRAVAHKCKGIFKVSSHQQTNLATGPSERWCFQGNAAADAVAAKAFQASPELMTHWEVLCAQLRELRKLRDSMHRMMLNIGLHCINKMQASQAPTQPACQVNQKPLLMTEWKLPESLPLAAQPYIIDETQALSEWIKSLHNDTLPVQRWSWWQLFVDALLHVPRFGPWYNVGRKQWMTGALQPPEPFLKKARSFSKYLHKLSKACNVQLPLMHATPSGTAIAFWTATLPVQVSPERTEQLDQWFGTHLPCAGKTADLRKVSL